MRAVVRVERIESPAVNFAAIYFSIDVLARPLRDSILPESAATNSLATFFGMPIFLAKAGLCFAASIVRCCLDETDGMALTVSGFPTRHIGFEVVEQADGFFGLLGLLTGRLDRDPVAPRIEGFPAPHGLGIRGAARRGSEFQSHSSVSVMTATLPVITYETVEVVGLGPLPA